MKEFKTIESEYDLVKLVASHLGTVYVGSDPQGHHIAVRRFHRDLAPRYVNAYVELIRRVKEWLESRSSQLPCSVVALQPLETGIDYVCRAWHLYNTSLAAFDWGSLERPKCVDEMRASVRSILGDAPDQSQRLIEDVITRSLLLSAGKTYCVESKSEFVIVEPKLCLNDIVLCDTLLMHKSSDGTALHLRRPDGA